MQNWISLCSLGDGQANAKTTFALSRSVRKHLYGYQQAGVLMKEINTSYFVTQARCVSIYSGVCDALFSWFALHCTVWCRPGSSWVALFSRCVDWVLFRSALFSLCRFVSLIITVLCYVVLLCYPSVGCAWLACVAVFCFAFRWSNLSLKIMLIA